MGFIVTNGRGAHRASYLGLRSRVGKQPVVRMHVRYLRVQDVPARQNELRRKTLDLLCSKETFAILRELELHSVDLGVVVTSAYQMPRIGRIDNVMSAEWLREEYPEIEWDKVPLSRDQIIVILPTAMFDKYQQYKYYFLTHEFGHLKENRHFFLNDALYGADMLNAIDDDPTLNRTKKKEFARILHAELVDFRLAWRLVHLWGLKDMAIRSRLSYQELYLPKLRENVRKCLHLPPVLRRFAVSHALSMVIPYIEMPEYAVCKDEYRQFWEEEKRLTAFEIDDCLSLAGGVGIRFIGYEVFSLVETMRQADAIRD